MKILVVDDERDLAVLAGLLLRRLGHVPILALDPWHALDLAGSDVDAVITDIEMPGMDGVELARRVRELDANMPIAFCTGSDPSAHIARRASRLGAVGKKLASSKDVEALLHQLRRPPQPAPTPRGERRQRAYVSVRYAVAGTQTHRHTHNLSRGGLFMRGADDLAIGQELDVEIELPGGAAFVATAEVAFLVSRDEAKPSGRTPGAGLKLTRAPPDYQLALESYLHRLGRRHNYVVLARGEDVQVALEEAGYVVYDVPPPDQLVATVAQSERAIAGVLVGSREAALYADAAAPLASPGLVKAVDDIEAMDRHISELDRML